MPSGVVKLSPIESNVVDRGALEDRLRSLPDIQSGFALWAYGTLGLPRRVTLVLPDIAVRSTVLQLEQVPLAGRSRKRSSGGDWVRNSVCL